MAQFKKTLAHLKQIRQRQYPQRRGAAYQPALRATAKEAPSVSWAGILTPAKLGRELHLIGTPAKWFGLLALYNPSTWDIWEERILHVLPYPHPLQGHALAAGDDLQPFKGTVDVAERMGRLKQHPRIADRSDPTSLKWIPWPYIGDLLLFQQDNGGPYCLNWSIKDTRKGFRRPGPKPRSKPRADVDDPNAVARADLEILYYQDAGIRTEQLSAEDIDEEVRNNLFDLFLSHRRQIKVSDDIARQAVRHLQAAVGTDTPAYRELMHIEKTFGLSKEQSIALLKQSIWRRTIRVDLFAPVLLDRPLRPEATDVVEHYASWFAR